MLLLIIPAILLVAVIAGISSLPMAHAPGYPDGPALVCMNDASNPITLPQGCPSTPFTFSGPFPSTPQVSPTQIRIGVYVNGTNALNGFDVTLLTNHLTLRPAGVDLTGSVLISPFTIIDECLSGVLVSGPVCAPTDTVDTLHFAATGALGQLTSPPTTGLLFTAIYDVVATTAAAGIPISYQTGCTGTSVPGGTCVTLSGGAGAPNPATVQTGTLFNNSVNPAWVAITGSPAGPFTVAKGSAGPTATITATAENGFPGFNGIDNVVFSAVVSAGFIAPTFSLPSCITGSATCTTVVTFNTATAGTYTATIFGTYVGDNGVTGVTLVGPVSFTVNIQDVGFTINGAVFSGTQTVFMAKTQGAPLFLVTAQSLGGYSGTISYTETLGNAGTTGMTTSSFVNPAPFTLGPGQMITKSINATAPNEGSATFRVNQVTSPSVGAHASGVITIKVSGFSISTNNSTVTNNPGDTRSVTATLVSLGNPAATNGFAGAVALSSTITGPTGTGKLTATCTSSVTLTAGGTVTGSCSFTGTLAGTYTVAVSGTGGTNNDMTNSTTVDVTINSLGPPPGINLNASPTSVTVSAGTAATSTITVAARGTFSGTVTLSSTVAPTTGGLSCTLTPSSVTLPPTATSALSCNNGAPGTYTVTVNAASGTTTNSTSVMVIVQDFTVVATPTSLSTNAGATGTSSIAVSSLGGFTGTVSLAVTTNSTNLVCTLSSTSIPGGSGTSTLSCHGSPAGNYLATVTGSSGSLSHSATVTFRLQDFAISSNPTSVTTTVGVAGTSMITVSPLNGFTGTVTLAVTTNSTNLTCTLATTSIPGGSGSSNLSCTGSVVGNYLATVAGTSASLSHSATVVYHVTSAPDFGISASPTSIPVNAGASATSTITITPSGGFTGTVTLAVTTNSTNLVCTLSSTSITGGSGTSTLSCHGSPAGNYLATVTGTSGTLSHSATVTYHVQDFNVSASPTSVSPNVNVAGTSAVTVAPLDGFGGTVTLTVTTNSTNLSCTLSATSISGGSGSSNLSCTGSVAGNYLATITGASGTLSHSATVTYHVTNAPDFTISANPTSVTANAGVAATSTITIAPLNGFSGTVNLAVTTNSTSLSCSLSSTSISGGSGTSTLSCTGSLSGNYLATVTGTSGTLSHSATVTYHSQDFAIAANPTTVNANVGVAGTSAITVSSRNGFGGTVTLAVTTNSTSLSCTLSSTSITGGSGTSTLSCTGSPAGNYLATVTGTSGTLSHSVSVVYHVTNAPDFAIAASPTSVNENAGATSTSTITVTAVNGFTGTVTLAVATNSTNLVCALSSTSIVGGSGTSTLSCHGSPAGNYLATVTGTSGTLSHPVAVTFHVQDFTVSANPTDVNVSTGVAGTSTISVAPVNSFTGTVTLAVTTNSTNLSCTLSSTSVAAGSGTSTLSCSASIAGNYLATVTGTNGALSHSTSVTYHVTTVAQPDFTISANPTAVTVNAGVAGTSTITIGPLNSFTSTVALSVTTNSTSLVCTLSSSSVTGGSGSSILSCNASLSGNYLATVTGSSGALSHAASVTYHVQDFAITASATSVSVPTGFSGVLSINVSSLNGFAGTVTLAVTTNSTNLSCTLNTAIIPGGSGFSTLSCSSVIAANYLATVTGTSDALSHSVTIVFHVTAADFDMSASSSTLTLNAGVAGTSTITISPTNGFIGTVALSVITNSSSLACTLSVTQIPGGGTSSLSCTGSAAGNYLARVIGMSGSLSHEAAVTYHVQDFSISANPTSVSTTVNVAAISIISVGSVNGFSGTVALGVTTNSTNLSCTLSSTSITGGSGSSTLSCSGSVAGNYLATVTGTSSGLSHSASVVYHVTTAAPPDFNVSASPTSVTVNTGVLGTSLITISSVNGFTGTVALSVTTNSTSLSCTLSSTSISGGSGTSTLSCISTSAANYSATVTGTNGSLSHSVSVVFHVTSQAADSTKTTVTCSPGSVTVNTPTSCTARVMDTSLSPSIPTGTVSFTTNSTGSFSPSAACTLVAGQGPNMATCSVSYTPTIPGHHLITAAYGGDSGHLTSSDNFTSNVRSSRGGPVLLTFTGFDFDDFDNGVGQLNVLVNGQLVVDIPAGLNQLTGTGDYRPYESAVVNFGPFDITSFVVDGQNSILFKDPTPFDHYGVVSNVTIVQDSSVLLHVLRPRGVHPTLSFSYTFSSQPLTVANLAALASPGQTVTSFALTFTGGTGPFTCIFSFGDGDRAVVVGSNGTCSTTHDYEGHGTFNVKVVVRGASTSDLQTARLTITLS